MRLSQRAGSRTGDARTARQGYRVSVWTTMTTRRFGRWRSISTCSSGDPRATGPRRHQKLAGAVAARLDLRGINPHRLHQILLHAVSAALAQLQIVIGRPERIGVALDRESRFRVALDERAELLQLADRARLQIGAVIREKLIVGHPQFGSRTERTFLREKRIEIAEARRRARDSARRCRREVL